MLTQQFNHVRVMEKITYASLGSLGEDFHQSFEAALKQLRAGLGTAHPMFIEGKAIKAKAGTFTDTAPADTRVMLGKFQLGGREDAHKAVDSARAVFPAWRDLGWRQRVALLRKAAE